MVRMGDRNSERIGGIAARYLDPRQQAPDHGMNLRLFCIADANDGLLDKPRRIFANLEAGPSRGKQANAARLPQFQRRLRVGIDEDLLDRRRLWLILNHQIGQRTVKHNEPFGQRSLGIGRNLPIGNMTKPVSNRCDHAPAGCPKSGVEAENDQPSLSITSSGTS
jgi:hypothetical protein